MIVSVNRRTPRADEIDQLTIIRRDERGAARRLHEKRRAAHGTKRAHGRVHAARNKLFGAGEEWSERVEDMGMRVNRNDTIRRLIKPE